MSGPAITLVLLPGMDGTGELFAGFVRALGATPTLVVAYPPDQVLDYEGVTNFARARLPLEQPFVLLGESFSGPVAIAMAAARPPGLLGLILCCSFARNPAPVFKPLRALINLLPVHAPLTRLIAPFLLGAASTPELRESLRSAIAAVAPAVLRARMRAVLDVDYSPLMGEVNVPVLYLQAARDRVVLAGAAEFLRTLCPTMQLIRIDGPHLLLQVKPAEAAQVILEFLAGLEDAPGDFVS